MRFLFETQPARFIERPNRFLVHASLLGSGEIVRAHCPDPGRLRELLIPGVALHVSPAPGILRSTSHTLRFVEHPETGILVSLDTHLTNCLFREGMDSGVFAPFAGTKRIETEVPVPESCPLVPADLVSVASTPTRPHTQTAVRSRIDFRLTNAAGGVCWVEVKSATLVEDRTAYFPDAVTDRGRRHLRELQSLVELGDRAAVCFIVQRPDAACLRPQWDRDPAFAQALLEVSRAGVGLYAYTVIIALDEARIDRAIPVVIER
jgi:sugar fermentation stimulation protein A